MQLGCAAAAMRPGCALAATRPGRASAATRPGRASAATHRHLLNLQSSFLPFQITGWSGRAGRPGEAITFSTEEDGRAGRPGEAITFSTEELEDLEKPFLRNLANVMAVSHCEVPAWILALPKLRKRKHRPHRDSISTLPEDST